MSLNDILFSEEFLFEGEQADKYLDKKAQDEFDKKHSERMRGYRRYGISGADVSHRAPTPKTTAEKAKRAKELTAADKEFYNAPSGGKSADIVDTAVRNLRAKQSYDRIKKGEHEARDAELRHMRRHPKQYKESAELYDGLELI